MSVCLPTCLSICLSVCCANLHDFFLVCIYLCTSLCRTAFNPCYFKGFLRTCLYWSCCVSASVCVDACGCQPSLNSAYSTLFSHQSLKRRIYNLDICKLISYLQHQKLFVWGQILSDRIYCCVATNEICILAWQCRGSELLGRTIRRKGKTVTARVVDQYGQQHH